MTTSVQKRLYENAGYQPVVLGVHLSWAFDNYAQADREYDPDVQLKMLRNYLNRLKLFLDKVVSQKWVVMLTALSGGPMWLDTYDPKIKKEVAKLHSWFVKFMETLSKNDNVHVFEEQNAGDACSMPGFIDVLSGINNPRVYVIGGFETGCLDRTVDRVQGQLDLIKIPELIFDEDFGDDFKRL